MKKSLFGILLLAFAALFTIISCKKDDGEPAPRKVTPERANFSAMLDTTLYNGVRNYGFMLNGRIHLYAFSEFGDSTFEFNLSGAALKAYPVNVNSETKVSFSRGNGEFYDGEVDPSKGGTITITKYSSADSVSLISGTFEFELRNRSSGETIKVTKGIFTDVPIFDSIPVEGEEIFIGLYGYNSNEGAAKFIRNKYTDSIQPVILASTSWINAFYGATVNDAGTQYLFKEDGRATKVVDLNTGATVSNFSDSEERAAPQYIGNKVYGLSNQGVIAEFNSTTGTNIQVIDTISSSFAGVSSTTDGFNLFFRTPDSLYQVTPSTKKIKAFKCPSGASYMGLDYLGLNTFYVVKHAVSDGSPHNYLEKWTILADNTISATTVGELQTFAFLSTNGNICSYNARLNKYYFVNGTVIEEFNIPTKKSKLNVLPGKIGGIRNR